MQDGFTRKITRSDDSSDAKEYFARHQVSLVTLTGSTAGNEYRIEKASTTIGRGPDVDLAFDDTAMSREHAALELVEHGFRIRDLGSTNGVQLNGAATLVADLKHADRLQLGEHTFQILVEKCSRAPRAYVVDDDA